MTDQLVPIHVATDRTLWNILYQGVDGPHVISQREDEPEAKEDARRLGERFNVSTFVQRVDVPATKVGLDNAAMVEFLTTTQYSEQVTTPISVQQPGHGESITPPGDYMTFNTEDLSEPTDLDGNPLGEVTEFAENSTSVGDIPAPQEFVEFTRNEEEQLFSEPDVDVTPDEAFTMPYTEQEWTEATAANALNYYVTVILSTEKPDSYHRENIARFIAPEEHQDSAVFTLGERITFDGVPSTPDIEKHFGTIDHGEES